MTRAILSAIVIHLSLLLASADAHYLWLAIDRTTGENGTANLYFEEGPRPGDGQYLDPFVNHGAMWLRTADRDEPVTLKMVETKQPGKRWLSAAVTAGGPRSVESYGKWGVYRYGQTDVLLHYYAKTVEADSAADLAKLAASPKLDLDIVPHSIGNKVEIQVLWHGKPAANSPVYVRGAGSNQTLKTDDKGMVSFPAEKAGQYTLRTSVEEKDKSGTDGGKEYQMVRHNSSLTINLPIAGG